MRVPVPIDQLKKVLVAEHLLAPDRFDQLSMEADRKGQSILDVLVFEHAVEAGYLYTIISQLLGVEMANMETAGIDTETLKLLPEEVARQRQVIAFRREPDGALAVAMVDPGDLEAINFLTQYLHARVKPYLATASDLNRGFTIYGLQTAGDFKKVIEESVQASLHSRSRSAEEAAADLPIVSVVDNLISYAAASRASDIHIEALEDSILIRYRIDGILYEVMRVPKQVHPGLVARIKLLSALKIDEHYHPQDGRFRFQLVNQAIDIRVSILPTYHGEKLVLRLLPATDKPLSLEEIGLAPEAADMVARNLKKAYGMVLTCGPTGSGKSTTLYALLSILNSPGVNIVTVEDPVEYNIRYVNQTQINPQAGITFASGLRSILRQDPNIIMVGEIRDSETAGIAVQAALTGHLLLSTLHTNDAITAIPRLFDLEVPPFLAASVLNVIIAQRLVRRVCSSCIQSVDHSPTIEKAITDQVRLLGLDPKVVAMPRTLYRGQGCGACAASGYRGRLGIFEVVEINPQIKEIISSPGFKLEKIQAAVRAAGMKTMFEDGLAKAELGLTTVEEVLRVVRE
ncbi:MAG: type II/IV secretion system protein [Candidatus Liptonbacteria bacterium]|nr:type II/IV secretion system protein [Candidatus Liptonbacteria bacterium]